ncbi:uncharacterized protein LOC124171233 [Ischnura elegans]|uniref:uncharacterized protein LOC124171233 n=1 Tax=Ischnura elegans TaxID=197161 RepID=UPI001ED87FEC|nr:uncharacterized protein LOC124171233 [Ischnura elegans]
MRRSLHALARGHTLDNISAETVSRALFQEWIARFGTPLRITTDQGRQFESDLFRQLNNICGISHLRTSAYHPAANGMVERLHRQLKSAIRCHDAEQWADMLPAILLGFPAAWKEDLQATSADLVYGASLRLPGEFLTPSSVPAPSGTAFVSQLREHFRKLTPKSAARHGS